MTNDNDKKFEELWDAENELYHEFRAWFIYSAAAVLIVVGYAAVGLKDLYIGLAASSLISAYTGFRMLGIIISWGIVHAKKCELGEETEED